MDDRGRKIRKAIEQAKKAPVVPKAEHEKLVWLAGRLMDFARHRQSCRSTQESKPVEFKNADPRDAQCTCGLWKIAEKMSELGVVHLVVKGRFS